MKLLQRLALAASLLALLLGSSGCTTALVVAHVHAQLTEGDPVPCLRLNSVQRALDARCAPYRPGSLRASDVAASGLPVCPLTVAARTPALWPVLPELLAKGAAPEACDESPLAALAAAEPCPDFGAADAASLAALRWLAEADPRAVRHDVLRLLSCPNAHAAGLDGVIEGWLAQGALPAGRLAFNPYSALHPRALASPLGRALEQAGHDPRARLGGYEGRLGSGFDEALKQSDWAALDWWLARVPELANTVPAQRANQLPWSPLAQVLAPHYLARPELQPAMVEFLLARGADPWRGLPHQPTRSIVAYARELKSPLVAALDAPRPAGSVTATALASAQAAPTPSLRAVALIH